MDSEPTSREEEDWELVNDDGFVYKRHKRRRLDPAAALSQQLSTLELDQKALAERKKNILLKLKARYQEEIIQWESLSNSLCALEESARQLQRDRQLARDQSASLASSSESLKGADFVGGSVVDELLLQVEVQEAIIHDVSNLCDAAEAMCDSQEKQFKQSIFDLPIWSSPQEPVRSLCDD